VGRCFGEVSAANLREFFLPRQETAPFVSHSVCVIWNPLPGCLHFRKVSALKTSGLLAFGLGGLILYSLFRKSTALNDLIFFPKGIKSVKFQSGSPVIDLNIGVSNVSNQAFTLNAVAGELWTNQTYIGYVSSFDRVTIHPRSEATVLVRVKLSLIGLVSQLIDGLSNGTWTQNLELDMQANIDNLQVQIPVIAYKIGK